MSDDNARIEKGPFKGWTEDSMAMFVSAMILLILFACWRSCS